MGTGFMLEQDDSEKYRIHSEAGILSILRSVMRNHALATCHFGRSGSIILTTIIDVDAKRREMVLDYGGDEASNQQALNADTLRVVVLLDNVKIQFVCNGIEKIRFEGRNAFRTRVPQTLLRIQRREHYRIKTLMSLPVKCTIPLHEKGASAAAEVILDDISCGGMAVIDTRFSVNFEPGAIYRNCTVALPEAGVANVDLQVRHVSAISRGHGQRARCIYVDPPDNVISMIQRYITRLELERKRKQ
ncbi:MAG: flagellar brake protein [Nitrosospira sp.]|nr:flagellar brake protein [Nitrosospira sp.]